MLFFKGVLRAAKPQPPEEQTLQVLPGDGAKRPPELCSGMRVDVMTMENHLLFVGRLQLLSGGCVELRRDAGGSLPQVLYNSKIRIQGIHRDSEPFLLVGAVKKSCWDFWQVGDLEVLQNRECRRSFRQKTDLEARVMPKARVRDVGRVAAPCKVLDVSAGGVRILTKNVYDTGESFVLEVPLLPKERPFVLTCEVVHVTARKHYNFEYGCKFEALESGERQRLTRAIYAIQKKMLQARQL